MVYGRKEQDFIFLYPGGKILLLLQFYILSFVTIIVGGIVYIWILTDYITFLRK